MQIKYKEQQDISSNEQTEISALLYGMQAL